MLKILRIMPYMGNQQYHI